MEQCVLVFEQLEPIAPQLVSSRKRLTQIPVQARTNGTGQPARKNRQDPTECYSERSENRPVVVVVALVVVVVAIDVVVDVAEEGGLYIDTSNMSSSFHLLVLVVTVVCVRMSGRTIAAAIAEMVSKASNVIRTAKTTLLHPQILDNHFCYVFSNCCCP